MGLQQPAGELIKADVSPSSVGGGSRQRQGTKVSLIEGLPPLL